MTASNGRTAEYPIDPIFLDRWSPRAFRDEEIGEDDLMTMLEAARWAPSAFNMQPWRFVWARRGTPGWDRLFDLLVAFNQGWVKDASALVFLVSDGMTRREGKDPRPSWSHSLDAGTASGYLALQATMMGWRVHGMTGFDMDRAPEVLNVPDGFRVEAAYAIGRPGDKALLPEDLRERERPSDRKPLRELTFEGAFPG